MATQILTGHADLNYHLSKLNRTIQPNGPLCMEEEETVTGHFLGQFYALGRVKVELFDTYYTTETDNGNRGQIQA